MMKMSKISLLLVLILSTPVVFAESTTITAEQWARPRSGEMIVRTNALAKLVNIFNKDSNHYFTLHYHTGDEGMLWAEELKAWMIALGIPSAKIVLLPGLEDGSRVEIELRSGKSSL